MSSMINLPLEVMANVVLYLCDDAEPLCVVSRRMHETMENVLSEWVIPMFEGGFFTSVIEKTLRRLQEQIPSATRYHPDPERPVPDSYFVIHPTLRTWVRNRITVNGASDNELRFALRVFIQNKDYREIECCADALLHRPLSIANATMFGRLVSSDLDSEEEKFLISSMLNSNESSRDSLLANMALSRTQHYGRSEDDRIVAVTSRIMNGIVCPEVRGWAEGHIAALQENSEHLFLIQVSCLHCRPRFVLEEVG